MKTQNLIKLSIFITLVAIVLLALKIYAPTPGWGGEIPGDNPPVTVETMVKIYMYFTDPNPNIGEVKSRIISPAELKSERVDVLIFPWEGKLKLEAVAPDGNKVTMYKNVMIDRGLYTERKYYFTWTTKQRGTHAVYVTLYNKEGVEVDSAKEVVNI